MAPWRVKAGAVIAAQGGPCDAFIVVESGELDGFVAEAGPTPVRTYGKGDCFGQLGLLYEAPHPLTIRCRVGGTLWVLRGTSFHHALLSICERRHDSVCRVLRKLPALEPLSPASLALLASGMQEVVLKPGAQLMRRHEEWDAAYIVVAGTLSSPLQGHGRDSPAGAARPRRTLRPSDFVGEEALVYAVAQRREAESGCARREASEPSSPESPPAAGGPESPPAAGGGGGGGFRPCRQPALAAGSAVLVPTRAPAPTANGNVLAGDSGCVLLRLPAQLAVEALAAAPPTPPASAVAGMVKEVVPEARASRILARLAAAEPCLCAEFTSAAQREQLLRALQYSSPPPGAVLLRKGELPDGILLVNAGFITPSRTAALGGISAAEPRAPPAVQAPQAHEAKEDPKEYFDCSLPEASVPLHIDAGCSVGGLHARPSSTDIHAGPGLEAVLLPRSSAQVLLAPTHECNHVCNHICNHIRSYSRPPTSSHAACCGREPHPSTWLDRRRRRRLGPRWRCAGSCTRAWPRACCWCRCTAAASARHTASGGGSMRSSAPAAAPLPSAPAGAAVCSGSPGQRVEAAEEAPWRAASAAPSRRARTSSCRSCTLRVTAT